MDSQPRPPYTLLLASQQAVSAWWEDRVNRDELRTLKDQLVATAAKQGLVKYYDTADKAAFALIRYLGGKGMQRADILGLEVEQVATAIRTARVPKKAGPRGRPKKTERNASMLERHEEDGKSIVTLSKEYDIGQDAVRKALRSAKEAGRKQNGEAS
jgi:Mor family transcriptional regulator